jgi:hypothetical protein
MNLNVFLQQGLLPLGSVQLGCLSHSTKEPFRDLFDPLDTESPHFIVKHQENFDEIAKDLGTIALHTRLIKLLSVATEPGNEGSVKIDVDEVKSYHVIDI